jgi:hypothetical protein
MSSEQQFSYNGPLSTYAEVHSLLIGLAAGLLAGWSQPIRSDLREEPHAAIGGFLVGVAAGTILRGD